MSELTPSRPSRIPWRVLLLLLLVAVAVASFVVFPVKDWLQSALEYIQAFQEGGSAHWGAAILAGMYILACVLFIPGSVLTLGAGFALGLIWGTVAVSVGATLGASAAFLIGRTIGRRWIEGKLSKNQKFNAIDEAVGKQGFKIVLLTRLSPIFPFNLLNFAFGTTKVSFRDYFLASWIGMIPGTIMYVYFGTTLKSLADVVAGKVEGGLAQNIMLIVGLIATVIVTVFITRVARKALNETISGEENPDDSKLAKGAAHA